MAASLSFSGSALVSRASHPSHLRNGEARRYPAAHCRAASQSALRRPGGCVAFGAASEKEKTLRRSRLAGGSGSQPMEGRRLELFGRIGANIVAGPRDVGPKLREFGWCVAHVEGLGGKLYAGSGGSSG